MKKISVILIVLFSLVSAGAVSAATSFSFVPGSLSVDEGGDFSATIKADPQGSTNYTVKAEVSFPADLLEVKSFSLSSGWMALSQSGYDLIDNTNGVLIKSGGYAGGFNTEKTLGVITFSSKTDGSGNLVFTDNSMALDQNNQNVYGGGSSMAVSVDAIEETGEPAAEPETTDSEPETSPGTVPEDTGGEEASTDDTSTTTEERATSSEEVIVDQEPSDDQAEEDQPKNTLLAGIAAALSLGTGTLWTGIIILLALVIGLQIFLWQRKKAKKN